MQPGSRSASYVFPLFPDMHNAVDEGNYFVANNDQTGLANAAAPVAFSATNPFIAIYNRDTGPTGKSIYLDFLTLVNTVIGTAGADIQFALTLDNGLDRYTSGGTDLTALHIFNPNGNSGQASIAKVRAGNITAAAATAAVRTIVGRRYLKGAIPVVGDEYTIKFGGVDAPSFIGVSTIAKVLVNVPKIVIPPAGSLLLHLWLTSQSAASSYAVEMGWIER